MSNGHLYTGGCSMIEHHRDERPTVRRVLGNTLRRHRERAAWSLRELAEKTTYNHTYIGRVERAEQLPSDALAHALDDVFDTGGTLYELLEAAREEVIQSYSREGVRKESEAARIQVFNSSQIPALLQTEGYMRALFRAAGSRVPHRDIDGAVDARLKRQRILGLERPPLYWAVFDEAALRRHIGGHECMREQLKRIIHRAQSPTTVCQVVPFDAGAHGLLGGSLTLLTMPNGQMLAHVEGFASGELIDSPERVLAYHHLFEVTRTLALPPDDSLALIGRYAEEDYA